VVIDKDQALKWLKVGAKPTATVTSLLRKQGVLDKFESEKKQ
jgi:small subunit ribosomal protein S16